MFDVDWCNLPCMRDIFVDADFRRTAAAVIMTCSGSAEYTRYKQQTSPLIPLPPIIYRNLPQVVKMVLFFEYPMFQYKPASLLDGDHGHGVAA